MKSHRKKPLKKFLAVILVAACCSLSLPVTAFAEDDVSTEAAAGIEESSDGEEISAEESESGGDDEAGGESESAAEDEAAGETESDAEDESDSESSSDEDESPAESESTTVTATVDEDGNVETGSTEGSDGADAADDAEESSLSLEGSTSGSDSGSSASSETKTTYKLSLTVSTKAASSSDDSIQTITVSYPKLTTTVMDADTGETVSSTTKTYSLTVKVSLPGVGWVQIKDTGSKYTYTTDSDSYIQAVNIKPSSSLKSALSKAGINFYYRATSEYLGQLGWAKAGQSAGSIGNQCPMTDLEFVISDSIPGSSEYRYISQAIVRYKTKQTGASSWNSLKANGSTSGKASTSYWIGSIAMDMDSDYMFDGDITYSARSSTSDASSKWTNWRTNYSAAGCGKYKLKAIKVKLTGDLADHFDVYYRVYLKGYGWLGWAKNGEKAGSHSTSLCICAVQVKLVPKGADAPGSTSTHYVSKTSSAKIAMIYAAQKYTSSSSYLIMVDRDNCRVGIFTGSKNKWTLKYYWECCVGKTSTPTPKGTYTVGIKQYSFGSSSYTCYYATQISGNYLFHSVLYYPGTFTVKDGTMGEAVSHGCVRLTLSHAKWIYNNIPTKTKIRIY